jgi:hypothetical protein
MQTIKTISMKEFEELCRNEQAPHFWHEHLPEAFIKKAGHVYDRLKGIDYRVDRVPCEQWIDDFRTERDYETALDIYEQCLKALQKCERKYGRKNEVQRRAFYCLALVRSCCPDPEQAFAETQRRYGFRFLNSDKKHLMRVILSCVKYVPLTLVHDVADTPQKAVLFTQTGTGKCRGHYLLGEHTNN